MSKSTQPHLKNNLKMKLSSEFLEETLTGIYGHIIHNLLSWQKHLSSCIHMNGPK